MSATVIESVPTSLPVPPRRGISRVALLSVHTSPLAQPGTGDGGGLNVYVREVASRLADRGVHVDIFTRRTDPDQPDTATLAPGVDVHHLTAGPLHPIDKGALANHLCAFVLALQRHHTAGQHELIHAHYWLSGWVGRRLAPRWGVPLIQTFHTLGALKNATLAPGDTPEPVLRLLAEERVARDADRVLVLTCGEARLLHRTYGLSGQRLTVVPAGVDLARFGPEATADAACDAALVAGPAATPAGAPDAVATAARVGAPQLLFVGRLQPLKGPDVAIRTLAEVRRTVPDAWLRIVGGTSGNGHGTMGPTELRALADGLGVGDAVVLEDALDQDRLADRYRAADVLLAPSRSETFGLVALEAQACGTPVVAADVPGLEAVVRDGGTLVPGHDERDHAAAVVGYLLDPARTAATRRAGMAAAREASWERTADRSLEVYEEVVATRAAARGSAHDVPISRTA